MITKDSLAEACRAMDNQVDTGKPFDAVMADNGIDAEGALYVAQQRALRTVLWMRGERNMDKYMLGAKPIKLSPQEQKFCDALSAAWVDGMITGAKAAKADVRDLVEAQRKDWDHIEAGEQALRALAEKIK